MKVSPRFPRTIFADSEFCTGSGRQSDRADFEFIWPRLDGPPQHSRSLSRWMVSIVWDKFTFPIETKEEYYELWQHQEERRRRNLAPGGRLTVGTKLKLLSAPTFSYLSLPPYDLSLAGSNENHLSNSFTRNTVVVLEKIITNDPAEGHAMLAPVWMARIKGRSYAVKIFQACFVKPEWSDSVGCHDFVPEEEQSHREAFAYATLRDLQGSKIPRSYGFYKVMTFRTRQKGLADFYFRLYFHPMTLSRFILWSIYLVRH